MSEESSLPIGAKPENIGKVVTIQVFKRSVNDNNQIVPESLQKYVGIFQEYHHDSKGFMFRLVGGERVFAIYKKHFIEIFV